MGRLSEALPLYEEALRRRRATLGPDHPDTLMSMNNLANLLRELGRYPEAIALQAEALGAEGSARPRSSRHPALLEQPAGTRTGGPLHDPNDCAGLGCESYNFLAYRVVEKNGALNGVRTIVTLIPERNIGIAVFANKQLTVFPEAVRAEFLERVLGQVGARPAEANSRRAGRLENAGRDPKSPYARKAAPALSAGIHRPLHEPVLRIPGSGPRG